MWVIEQCEGECDKINAINFCITGAMCLWNLFLLKHMYSITGACNFSGGKKK